MEGIKTILSTPCNCLGSTYRDRQCGHIITGDKNIVEDLQLRELFGKGIKYRLPKKIDWTEIRNITELTLDKLIITLAGKTGIPIENFYDFKTRFLYILDNRIRFWMTRENGINEHTLSIRKVRELVKNVHENLVIAPADKAANNPVFICKKFYVSKICDEFGINYDHIQDTLIVNEGNDTYKRVQFTTEQLIARHQAVMNKYGIAPRLDMDKIPRIFALPKLHKNPIKFRFIAGASSSTIKPLSQNLLNILKYLKGHLRNYCNAVTRNSGINVYWSVDNGLKVVNALQNVNRTQRLANVCTYDFSTLFTKLPFHVILENLFFLVDKLVRNSYINVTYTKCYPSTIRSANVKNYTGIEIKEMIKDILEESYAIFGGCIFRQKCGVPMGGNASPLIADLVLSTIEFRYLSDARNYGRAVRFKNSYRYMDDILVTTNLDSHGMLFEMYPSDLTLETTDTDPKRTSFLDLDIKVVDDLVISLYNKTDDFSFQVVRYGFSDSNMDREVGLRTYGGELLRIGRMCMLLPDFKTRAITLTNTMRQQGYKKDELFGQFLKFIKRNNGIMVKYNIIRKPIMLRLAFECVL